MRPHTKPLMLLPLLWAIAASAAVTVAVGPAGQTVTHGETLQFTAAVTGTTNTSVIWSINPTLGSISASGLYTAPASVFQTYTITVTATSLADTTKAGSVTFQLVPTVGISIAPQNANLSESQTQQFTASVTGTTNTAVTWSITPQVGNISNTGLYTAPSVLSGKQTVTVRAVSVADPTQAATATINLAPTAQASISVSPTSASLRPGQSQQFTATVTGLAITLVNWSITPQIGTITPQGLYTAPDTVASAQSITVTATSIGDPSISSSATVNLSPSPSASVSISPASATLQPKGTQQFTATVNNANTTSVTWSISPQVGSISSSGLYTAPDTITTQQTVTVTATSVADLTKSASATVTLTPATTPVDVGSGAPNSVIQQQFISAFYRNGFNALVSLPPLGNVRRFGTTGLVQEFADAVKGSSVKLALVKADTSTGAGPPDGTQGVYQIGGDLYSYYSGQVSTVGYPTMDSQKVPNFDPAVPSCTYGIFDKGFALFAYATALFTGQDFTVRNQFYTKWTALGGINGLGAPIDAEQSITALTGTTAAVQVFSYGAIYVISSGANNGKVYGVSGAIYTLYKSMGGPSSAMGLPAGDDITGTDGVHRQLFEGGTLTWTPGSDPGVLLPVAGVIVSLPAGGNIINMNAGTTAQLTAIVYAGGGTILTGRTVTWTTSNGRVATVQSSGTTATLTAVGSGTASIQASSEGKVSTPVTVIVTSQCCAIGEGAPTAAIQQAFQDAVTRNRLSILLPAANPVRRVTGGYVQQLQSSDTKNPVRYLLGKSDRVATAYYVTGDILTAYEAAGGPGGSLGLPVSDPTSGGRQLFENGALAGTPVRTVTGVILTKWANLGYETGSAGPPGGDSATFTTITATAGVMQAFRNGTIYAATNGSRAGQAFLVSGLIQARYAQLGGPTGDFGMPLSDEFANGNLRQQNFEGGTIDYAAGDRAATEHPVARGPSISAIPSTVMAGSRVRLAVTGFPAGSNVRVTVSGQTDFLVTLANGAYSWNVYVPLTAGSGTVTIRAVDTAGPTSATGSYQIKGLSEARAQIAKTQGDGQTGVPGAELKQTLRVALRDTGGNPVIGASVVFQASPGAVVRPSSALTDESGQAETTLRLPLSEGVVLATADSPGVVTAPVTFSARSAAASLNNFLKLSQNVPGTVGNGNSPIAQKGALLTAAAGIVRYHQVRGEMSTLNGMADPAGLNGFLKKFCSYDSAGHSLCDGFLSASDSGEQVLNLWRVGEFVAGGVDVAVENPDPSNMRKLVAQGSPVLVALALQADGNPAGGHFVVATGVAADGSIQIQDPSPDLARGSLFEYGAGFSAAGHSWTGTVTGAVRLLPRTPSPTRFLLAAVSQPQALVQKLSLDVSSLAGTCGRALDLPDAAVPAAGSLAALPPVSRFVVCDGDQSSYQVSVGAAQPYRVTVTDFAAGGAAVDLSGNAAAVYKFTRPALQLVVAPQDLAFAASAVVNGATFTSGISPGGLFSVFGAGLSNATATFDGQPAKVLLSSAFQMNAQVPPDLAPGSHTLTITSPQGAMQQTVEVRETAPAIFLLGSQDDGAVVNQDGKINSPLSPIRRGQVVVIYCTGLGATETRNRLDYVKNPVTAALNGQELPVTFAGLTPGYTGLYQVNLTVPATAPPGLDLPLQLRQPGAESNTVLVSLQ